MPLPASDDIVAGYLAELADAGLKAATIARRLVVISQAHKAADLPSPTRALLGLARLRRQRAAVVASHGEDIYRHVEANLHWQAFQLLGKLRSIVYLLQRQR